MAVFLGEIDTVADHEQIAASAKSAGIMLTHLS
jgi:hypothetical protein